MRKHEDGKRCPACGQGDALGGIKSDIAYMLKQCRRQAREISQRGCHLIRIMGQWSRCAALCCGIPDGHHQSPPTCLIHQFAVNNTHVVRTGGIWELDHWHQPARKDAAEYKE